MPFFYAIGAGKPMGMLSGRLKIGITNKKAVGYRDYFSKPATIMSCNSLINT